MLSERDPKKVPFSSDQTLTIDSYFGTFAVVNKAIPMWVDICNVEQMAWVLIQLNA